MAWASGEQATEIHTPQAGSAAAAAAELAMEEDGVSESEI